MAVAEAEAKAAAAKEAYGKARRFFIPTKKIGQDFKITFLDGDLDDDGGLSQQCWQEHENFVANQNHTFVCIEGHAEESCPICEHGNYAYLAVGLSIIDHSSFTARDQKVYKDQKRAFVFKRQTLKTLQALAVKYKGLRGCTFEVQRTGNQVARVGDMFMYLGKTPMAKLVDLFGEETCTPYVWETELTLRDRAELIKLGWGGTKVMSSATGAGNTGAANLDTQL